MQTTDDAAGGELGDDVAEAVVRVAGSRRVIKGQKNPGDELRQECE